MRRVALTGGPGAGKTTISAALAGRFPDRFAVVPEAASQVYATLNARWDQLDLNGRRDAQRRIYALQRQQEDDAAEFTASSRILLCDRGSIDGAAYWPEGPDDYWRQLRTTAAAELARYDRVLWMQTGAVLGIYDGRRSNACRFEDAEAAVASGNLLRVLWTDHPNLTIIDACPTLDEKINAVLQVLHQ